MTHLLDTHALLWALTDPARLGEQARMIIANRKTRLIASAASAWEIATKHRIGKLPRRTPWSAPTPSTSIGLGQLACR